MVGQLKNKNQISSWKVLNTLPRTLMITGAKGCGKKTLARYIASEFDLELRWCGNKVEDIRSVIAECQSLSAPTMFVFVNADNMSLSAKNSLLKVTEEPPTDAYFALPLEDAGNTLKTIKSRSIEMQIEPYSRNELSEFTDDELCLEIATNPGEIIELQKLGVDNLVMFVDKVVDNVDYVSSGNALNIAKSVRFKEDDEGYPLSVFWRVFNNRVTSRLLLNPDSFSMKTVQKYHEWVTVTQRYLNYLGNASINKRMLFDMWIFDIRK